MDGVRCLCGCARVGCLKTVYAQPARVPLCHTDDDGVIRLKNVNQDAAQAHINHDDFSPVEFFADADDDGFGNAEESVEDCTAPEGFVDNSDDCDDQYFGRNLSRLFGDDTIVSRWREIRT